MSSARADCVIKLLIIGDSGVGKSSILLRFAENSFTPSYMTTIGIDYKLKTIHSEDGKKIVLQIWDTAGQERFRTITPSFYRKAHGIILVYDVHDESSFQNIRGWMKTIDEEQDGATERSQDNTGILKRPVIVEKIVIGNKCDTELVGVEGEGKGETRRKAVESAEGAALAKEYGIDFMEVSAKDGTNVEAAFLTIVKKIKARGGGDPSRRHSVLGSLSDPADLSKKSCACR